VEQVFVGRETELAAISQRLAAAAEGRGGVVWIEGDAGFGKTALVRRVIATLPSEFAVISAEADELSREQPFGVVTQLGAAIANGSFAVGLELLRLAGEHAERRPVLVAVEDMHWADVGSREALVTMARRLDTECVELLVTSRPGGGEGEGWDRLLIDEKRCRRVKLDPLSKQQVGEWANRLGIGLSAAHVARLHRHTGGHPLYVKTLLNELTPEQLTSTTQELPAPRSLASATIAALAELPEEANRLVSALAVLGQRTPLAVVARVAGVAEPAPALESLLTTGFVRWLPAEQNTPIDFVHPIYRLAVYDDLSPTRRQALHRRAAANLGRIAGWPHRVAAADTADDELADELESGSGHEIDRGASGLAATYLLWAAPLTSRRAVAETRLLQGARLLLADGELDRLHELLPGLQACEPTPLRDLVLGSYALETGDAATAQRLLSCAAADADADPTVQAEANVRLSGIYVMQGEPVRQAEAAAAALSLDPTDDQIARTAWGSLASAESTLNGAPAGLAVLAQRLPAHAADVAGADAELLVVRGLLKLYAAETWAGIDDLRAAIRMSRAGFSHQHLPAAHIYLARALYIVGEWDEALVHARATQAIVADDRHSWIRGRAEFVLGTVAASRGQWDDADRYLTIVESAAKSGVDPTWPELLARVLKSALARARGDPAGVVAALEPLATDKRVVVSQMAMIAWWPILIEALIEVGNTDAAASEIERLARHIDDTHMNIHGQLAGLRARLAAATGDPGDATRLFEVAIATIRPDDGLIDRGLLRHRYGRLLHARGNRREAVGHLRAAHELFDGVGAEPYRKAVADDLAVCGIRTPTTQSRSPLDFTEREQDVVALVRKGMTNKEIAAEMYVSEKAVEYHLRNVYGKLGISSRRELRD
jgi:DNA-binding CsgD family transcriptional regulator